MTAAHKTAITRGELSRPLRLALSGEILKHDDTFFDFGCGKGEDIKELEALGIDASGWDPYHRSDGVKTNSDVVNLGYVINVIEDPEERIAVLKDAWELTKKALIVSARLMSEERAVTRGRPHGDGYITGHDTFQKFYTQTELRMCLDLNLEVESIAAAPGVFVIFKNETDANEYIIKNRRRRFYSVKVSRADKIYEENTELLNELIDFFTQRGRLPRRDEDIDLQNRLKENVGGIKRAWNVIAKVTEDTNWEEISDNRRDDLLVDLALLKLNRRPNFMSLPEQTRHDIKDFFGSYKQAVTEADELLFSAGNFELIEKVANHSPVGKRLPTALYVHISALENLPPVLRVYEGCARWLIGEVDTANIIKLATHKPKVSYLTYPNFEKDPHPALYEALFVRIRDLDVDGRDYKDSDNPPILHRKEEFISEENPLFERFKRLTKQEERFNLYECDTRLIGYREQWNEHVEKLNLEIRGHRVIKKDA